MRIGLAAAALVDLISAGGAAWTGSVESLGGEGRFSHAPTAHGLEAAARIRQEVRSAVSQVRELEGVAHSLAAVCESAGVSAFVLSQRCAADQDIDLQLTHLLAADPLNRRLTGAIGVLLGGPFRTGHSDSETRVSLY